MGKKRMRRIYLDYAATTPTHPAVLKAMAPYFTRAFGNPGSVHTWGQEAIAATDRARERIAEAIGFSSGSGFRNIVFTGSATEANNLALRGALRALLRRSPDARPRIIISAIEHESVFETAKDIEADGADLVVLPVDAAGAVDLEALRRAIDDRTALVSVMYVNNEIGAVEPLSAIAGIIAEKKRGLRSAFGPSYPLFHVDAAQAFAYFDCSPSRIGADLVTLSGHKIYGPKGVGALILGDPVPVPFLSPIISGGGQEFGLRSGTENVPSIVGFAEAVSRAAASRSRMATRISALRAYAIERLRRAFPEVEIHGEAGAFAPHIINVRFPGADAQGLLTALDLLGISIGAGSACGMRSLKLSRTISALGGAAAAPRESVRISLGAETVRGDIDAFLRALADIGSPHVLPQKKSRKITLSGRDR